MQYFNSETMFDYALLVSVMLSNRSVFQGFAAILFSHPLLGVGGSVDRTLSSASGFLGDDIMGLCFFLSRFCLNCKGSVLIVKVLKW